MPRKKRANRSKPIATKPDAKLDHLVVIRESAQYDRLLMEGMQGYVHTSPLGHRGQPAGIVEKCLHVAHLHKHRRSAGPLAEHG
jgi:hypothetical protein